MADLSIYVLDLLGLQDRRRGILSGDVEHSYGVATGLGMEDEQSGEVGLSPVNGYDSSFSVFAAVQFLAERLVVGCLGSLHRRTRMQPYIA